jgi:hypothetical protein
MCVISYIIEFYITVYYKLASLFIGIISNILEMTYRSTCIPTRRRPAINLRRHQVRLGRHSLFQSVERLHYYCRVRFCIRWLLPRK